MHAAREFTQSERKSRSKKNAAPLNRLAAVLKQIGRVLDSFVAAGHFEIDPAKQTLAGLHRKVDISTAKPRQLMFDLDAREAVNDAYVGLSGVLAPKGLAEHFTRLFLPRLGDSMTHGPALPVAPCIW